MFLVRVIFQQHHIKSTHNRGLNHQVGEIAKIFQLYLAKLVYALDYTAA